MDVVAEAAGVVLLEEAFLGAALRTTNEADRPAAGPRQHDRGDGSVVVGELPLGDAAIGIDHPVPVADLDLGCGLGVATSATGASVSSTTASGFLSSRRPR